jgi:histidinol-phosphate phosphatase family protein
LRPSEHHDAADVEAALRRPARLSTRRVVFLDKDGTLVHDVPHNVDPELLDFTPFAFEGLRLLVEAGFAIVVVTNQPGIGAGRFTRQQFARLQSALQRRVRDEGGVDIADVYCCPHVAGPEGRPACLCRKPAPGMLKQAAAAHRLELSRCWMIGDILDDVEAGHRAGCRSILLDVGNETEWKLSPTRKPDAVAGDLLDAARIVVEAEQLQGAQVG